jgi:predicted PhzF superfamily epimerase YddE/YHI9
MHRAVTRSVRTCAAIAAIALVLAGCGGSSKGGAQTTQASSFQTQVDRICTATYSSARVPPSESHHLPSLPEIAQARAHTAQELSVLHPPTALTSGYRRLVVLIAHEAALLRRLDRDLREGNAGGALATHRELRSNNKVARQARLLGLVKCA